MRRHRDDPLDIKRRMQASHALRRLSERYGVATPQEFDNLVARVKKGQCEFVGEQLAGRKQIVRVFDDFTLQWLTAVFDTSTAMIATFLPPGVINANGVPVAGDLLELVRADERVGPPDSTAAAVHRQNRFVELEGEAGRGHGEIRRLRGLLETATTQAGSDRQRRIIELAEEVAELRHDNRKLRMLLTTSRSRYGDVSCRSSLRFRRTKSSARCPGLGRRYRCPVAESGPTVLCDPQCPRFGVMTSSL